MTRAVAAALAVEPLRPRLAAALQRRDWVGPWTSGFPCSLGFRDLGIWGFRVEGLGFRDANP